MLRAINFIAVGTLLLLPSSGLVGQGDPIKPTASAVCQLTVTNRGGEPKVRVVASEAGRSKPGPPPSRFGCTFKFDPSSLPKGVTLKADEFGHFIANSSDAPLIVNESFQGDALAGGTKLISGKVYFYFPNGIPEEGKQHLKGWQNLSDEIKNTRLHLAEPATIYNSRKPGVLKDLPKAELFTHTVKFNGKPHALKGTIHYHLNPEYDAFHQAKEVAVLGSTMDLGMKIPGKGVRALSVRSEDDLLAAAGIPADKRDKATRERVVAEWAKALKVAKIDFQKQMIVSVAFDFSPTPRTFPEVFQVVASENKVTVHWRWVSPEIDTDRVGPGRIVTLLMADSRADVVLQSGPARVLKK